MLTCWKFKKYHNFVKRRSGKDKTYLLACWKTKYTQKVHSTTPGPRGSDRSFITSPTTSPLLELSAELAGLGSADLFMPAVRLDSVITEALCQRCLTSERPRADATWACLWEKVESGRISSGNKWRSLFWTQGMSYINIFICSLRTCPLSDISAEEKSDTVFVVRFQSLTLHPVKHTNRKD